AEPARLLPRLGQEEILPGEPLRPRRLLRDESGVVETSGGGRKTPPPFSLGPGARQPRPRAISKYTSTAVRTWSRSTHSSFVWAWAMSPGPKTRDGMPAWAKGPASVPYGTPITSGVRPITPATMGRSAATHSSFPRGESAGILTHG